MYCSAFVYQIHRVLNMTDFRSIYWIRLDQILLFSPDPMQCVSTSADGSDTRTVNSQKRF